MIIQQVLMAQNRKYSPQKPIMAEVQKPNIIVKTDNTRLEVILQEINDIDIKYKKFSNPNGVQYVIRKEDVARLIHSNGEIETITAKVVEKTAITTQQRPSKQLNEPTTQKELPQPLTVRGVKAKLYFIRSTGFQGSLFAFMAFIDDEVVCKLNNNRYSIHEVAPGEHTVSVQFYGKKSKKEAEHFKIVVESGKTYYVQMIYQDNLFSNLYCQEVTENSAKPILDKLKEDTACY